MWVSQNDTHNLFVEVLLQEILVYDNLDRAVQDVEIERSMAEQLTINFNRHLG